MARLSSRSNELEAATVQTTRKEKEEGIQFVPSDDRHHVKNSRVVTAAVEEHREDQDPRDKTLEQERTLEPNQDTSSSPSSTVFDYFMDYVACTGGRHLGVLEPKCIAAQSSCFPTENKMDFVASSACFEDTVSDGMVVTMEQESTTRDKRIKKRDLHSKRVMEIPPEEEHGCGVMADTSIHKASACWTPESRQWLSCHSMEEEEGDADRATIEDGVDKPMQKVAAFLSPRSQQLLSWIRRDNNNNNNDNEQIVATIHKEHKRDSLGVFIKRVLFKSGLYISSVHPNSKFTKTDLKAGMKILTINEHPCPETVKDFKALTAELEGDVTIVAEMEKDEDEGRAIVSVYKECRNEQLGLLIKKKVLKDGLFVGLIAQGGKFDDTELKPGMRIVRINDQPCPNTVEEAKVLLAFVEGEVTIVAEDQPKGGKPTLNSADPTSSPLEIRKTVTFVIAEDHDEVEIVASCSDAENGMMTMEEAANNNSTRIYTTWNGEERKEVVCVVFKNMDETLGLILREFKGEEGVHVLQIYQKSKLASTALQPGMTIHKINQKDCPRSADECTRLLRRISGRVEIVASEVLEDR